MIGDQLDMVRRLKAALVTRWFANAAAGQPSATPILDGLLSGPGWMWSWLYSLLQYVAQQRFIQTATGINLDQIALDYFGNSIKRFTNEGDAAFAARIKANLLAPKGTRQAVIDALTTLTGFVPAVFEPARSTDTGGYGHQGMTQGTGLGYGVAGGYGSLLLPFQAFITAYRPVNIGIGGSQGYYSLATRGPAIGGYGVGSIQYGSLQQLAGLVTDADIYATIASVAPEATILWTAITNQSGVQRSLTATATLAVLQASQTLSAAAVALLGSGITATLHETQDAQLLSAAASVGGTKAALTLVQAAQTITAAGYVPAVWNASDEVNVETSNNGLTATTTSAAQAGIRSSSPASSGALYAEVTATTAGASERVGIANGAWSKSSVLGSDNNSISIDPTGAIHLNGVVVGQGPSWTVGSVIQIAPNFATHEIWFGVNGSWGSTIQSGVSGSHNTGTSNPVISGPATAAVSAGSGVPLADFITPGSGSFTDSSGNVYTIDSSGNSVENGTDIPSGANTRAMELYNGTVYAQDNIAGTWYTWNGSSFQVAATPPPAPSAGGTVALTGLTLADTIWPNSANVTLSVTCTSGTVAMTVSGSQVPGSGTNSISYSSTTANVQAAAASLAYTAASNGTADTVVIKVIDQVGSTNTLSIPVTVGGVPNPATGVGGISFASMAAGPYMLAFGAAVAGAAKVGNWGGSAFGFIVPQNFLAWNPAPNSGTTALALSSGSETANSITLTWSSVTSGGGSAAPGIPTNLSVVAQGISSLVATWSPPTSGGSAISYQLQYRAAASPNGTVVTPGNGTIIDAAGNVWAVSTASQVTVNGTVDTTTANVTHLAFVGGALDQENTAGNWFTKTSPTGTWTATTAPTIPTPVPTPWTNASLVTASPNGTIVTPGNGVITDNSGNAWAINPAAQITVNGTIDTATSNVTQLAWLNGALVQENTAGNWYSETTNNDSWVQVAAPTFPSALTISQTIANLVAGTAYQLQVSAANSAGSSLDTAPVTASTTAVVSGNFTISEGRVFGLNGQPFVAKGVCMTDQSAVSAATILSLWPHTNIMNYAIGSDFANGATGRGYLDAPSNAAIMAVINDFTSKGIVVVISDYVAGQPVPRTGSDLTNMANWYATLAALTKTNPLVWFLTSNEIAGPVGPMWTATYNAVRGAGNNNLIWLECAWGACDHTFDSDPSVPTTMTGVGWAGHGYAGNFPSADVTGVRSIVNLWQTFGRQSQDGVMPYFFAEQGPSSNGTDIDDTLSGSTYRAMQAVDATTTGNQGDASAYTAWVVSFNGGGYNGGDAMLQPNTEFTSPAYTTWGTQVKNELAANPPG